MFLYTVSVTSVQKITVIFTTIRPLAHTSKPFGKYLYIYTYANFHFLHGLQWQPACSCSFILIGWIVEVILRIFDFQYGGRPPSGTFEICKFSLSERLTMAICIVKICLFIQNFITIGCTVAEISRFSDFQYGGRPPSWICDICKFRHSARFTAKICLFVQNFVTIGWTVAELLRIKYFSIWRPSAILDLLYACAGPPTMPHWCSEKALKILSESVE